MAKLSPDLELIAGILRSRTWPDQAVDIDRELLAPLRSAGFSTRNRVSRPYSDRHGRNIVGRIDLVAERTEGLIAIEVDRFQARIKSIKKLRLFKGKSVLVIRCGKSFRPKPIRGIDLVISVTVHRDRQEKAFAERYMSKPLMSRKAGTSSRDEETRQAEAVVEVDEI